MSLAPNPAPLTGELVDGRYRVGEVIGRGAMSEVYRAVDLRLDRAVALKALRPGVADRERFDEETALLCSLDHPNLVKLHDAGEHDGVPYLVLNLLDRSLADVLAAGVLDAPTAARIGSEIAAALDYLHERGIVHRDVKPSNVLLRADGSACLADLGAALSADGARLTATGMTIGTPMYLAPEQASGAEVTAAADVYSLGLVLLEATSGRPAFGGSAQEAVAARLAASPSVPATLPPGLRGALTSMVAVDPALRPAAGAVAADLRRASLDAPDDETQALHTTAVLPVATEVLPVPPEDEAPDPPAAPAPDVVERAGDAAAAAGAAAYAGARRWIRADRDRAALLGVGLVLVVGLLVGLASADAGFVPRDAVVSADTTVPTTAPTTVPTTVAPAPPPAPPEDACEDGCGNGREGEEGRDGHDKGEGRKD